MDTVGATLTSGPNDHASRVYYYSTGVVQAPRAPTRRQLTVSSSADQQPERQDHTALGETPKCPWQLVPHSDIHEPRSRHRPTRLLNSTPSTFEACPHGRAKPSTDPIHSGLTVRALPRNVTTSLNCWPSPSHSPATVTTGVVDKHAHDRHHPPRATTPGGRQLPRGGELSAASTRRIRKRDRPAASATQRRQMPSPTVALVNTTALGAHTLTVTVSQ